MIDKVLIQFASQSIKLRSLTLSLLKNFIKHKILKWNVLINMKGLSIPQPREWTTHHNSIICTQCSLISQESNINSLTWFMSEQTDLIESLIEALVFNNNKPRSEQVISSKTISCIAYTLATLNTASAK